MSGVKVAWPRGSFGSGGRVTDHANVENVRSPDGTQIAVWVSGEGPPIVLVHGSMTDHSYLDALAQELNSSMKVYAMDRRGFGASGDGATYDITREFEDVAAVVDHVTSVTGEAPVLFGHSFGAGTAMGGAALTDAISHLILYEPGLGLEYPDGSIDAIEAAVAIGDPDRALSIIYTEILEMSREELASRQASPSWEGQLSTAPTLAREARAEQSWQYQPGQFDEVLAPTLFIAGALSPPEIARVTNLARQAISGALLTTLDDHAHSACRNDPALVADAIRRFVS